MFQSFESFLNYFLTETNQICLIFDIIIFLMEKVAKNLRWGQIAVAVAVLGFAYILRKRYIDYQENIKGARKIVVVVK